MTKRIIAKYLFLRILFFLFYLSISILGIFPLAFGTETKITLVYTTNTLGKIESGCCLESGNMGAGGLAKRAYYIKNIRKGVKNFFILDGGDILAMGLPGSEKEREKARKRAEFVLKIYEKMGYDALNIGDTDLVLGVEYLKTLQKLSKIPFLSANLKDKKTGKTIFKTYLVKVMDGLRVGIIGLLTLDVPPYILGGIKDTFIEDPIKVATETINCFMFNSDLIIILAHLNPAEIESLAKRVPQISIIIGGNDRTLMFPKHLHRSIWVQTDAFGLHIGRLNLTLVKGSSEFVDILPRNLIQKNIEEVQKKMRDPQYAKEINSLKKMQKILIEEKKKLSNTGNKNTYENFLI